MASATNAQTGNSDWLFAVGEPTRLTIIRILARGKILTVTELAKQCKTEIANISFHLGILRGAGLVEYEPDAQDRRRIYYRLLGATSKANELELTHKSGTKVILPLK